MELPLDTELVFISIEERIGMLRKHDEYENELKYTIDDLRSMIPDLKSDADVLQNKIVENSKKCSDIRKELTNVEREYAGIELAKYFNSKYLEKDIDDEKFKGLKSKLYAELNNQMAVIQECKIEYAEALNKHREVINVMKKHKDWIKNYKEFRKKITHYYEIYDYAELGNENVYLQVMHYIVKDTYEVLKINKQFSRFDNVWIWLREDSIDRACASKLSEELNSLIN